RSLRDVLSDHDSGVATARGVLPGCLSGCVRSCGDHRESGRLGGTRSGERPGHFPVNLEHHGGHGASRGRPVAGGSSGVTYVSAKDSSGEVAGQPIMTRNMSSTKRATAMSLK